MIFLDKKSIVKTVLLVLVGCFFVFTQATSVNAAPKPDENKVIITEPTTNVDVLYDTYKDNAFELMTKEKEQETTFGVKEAITNASAVIKTFIWAAVKGLGQFNAEMVKTLFSMDIITAIKEPIMSLTASIATNMTGIAGTIGIAFVFLILGIKFVGQQKYKRFIGIFLMTIAIFTGLSVLKDANTSNSFFDLMFSVDKEVETAFVNINPVLGDTSVPTTEKVKDKNGNEVEQALSPEKRVKSAGDLIASRVFYTNVYEPYLLMNYGTSDVKKIRKKTVTYKEKDYDRINLLLDNDMNNDDNEKLLEDVTNYEAKELKNRSIMYYNNWTNTFYGLFYLVVNLIQTVVYFLLSFLRLIVAVIQLFLLPLLPLLLFAGLFLTESNVFANYFKTFGMTIFMKGLVGFATIFFASFLSLGFQLSNQTENVWQKIFTILIYLLTPIGLYIFRKFFGNLVTGRVSLSDGVGFIGNPFGTEANMRRASKERKRENKERRKQAQEERKAALKKRREEAEKNGRTDTGIKPRPLNKEQEKRSALRRELKQKPQHKAPNVLEKAQDSFRQAHEKGRIQEQKAEEQRKRQQQEKARQRADETERLKKREALQAINQQGEEGNSLTALRNQNRRTGQRSVKRETGSQAQMKRQGDKATPPVNTPKETKKQGVPRSPRRTGQPTTRQTIQPKPTTNPSKRVSGTGGSNPAYRRPEVRQKMAQVTQVAQATAPKVSPTQSVQPPKEPPITRMGKRNAPQPKKEKSNRQAPPVRRERKKSTNQPPVTKSKGVRQPRARK